LRRTSDYIFLVIGAIALLFGVFFLAFPEITYETTEQVSLGPVSIVRPKTKTMTVPGYLSTVMAVAGAFVILFITLRAQRRGG
jgi:hypothetical protein